MAPGVATCSVMQKVASAAPHRFIRLSTTGHTIAVSEFGKRSSPHVVLFNHGWPGSRVGGKLTDAAAQVLGLRVLAFDRPGYGKSPLQPYTLPEYGTMVTELADQLNVEEFSLLGVSGGAAFATACAKYAGSDRVVALGLLCPLGKLDTAASHRGLIWAALNYPDLCEHIWAGFRRALTRDPLFLAKGLLTAREDKNALLSNREAAALTQAATVEGLSNGAGGWLQDAKWLNNEFSHMQLEDIHVPQVHLWYGLKDKSIPRASAELYERIPGCRAHYMPDEGHLSICINRMSEVLATMKLAHTMHDVSSGLVSPNHRVHVDEKMASIFAAPGSCWES